MKLSELKEYEIREYGEKRWEELEQSSLYKLYNSSTEERIEILRCHGELIKYINNPTKREQKVAIKQNWRSLQYIDNPSEELQLQAVRQCYFSLLYLHNPSDKVLKEALKDKNCSIIDMLKHLKNDLKGGRKNEYEF